MVRGGLDKDLGEEPKGLRIPPAAKATNCDAVERHGMVWVWLGDRKADPALIPDLSPLDSDGAPPASGPHYVQTGAPPERYGAGNRAQP